MLYHHIGCVFSFHLGYKVKGKEVKQARRIKKCMYMHKKGKHTTNVVIQQKSRRLLMMDVLMSENQLSIEEVK